MPENRLGGASTPPQGKTSWSDGHRGRHDSRSRRCTAVFDEHLQEFMFVSQASGLAKRSMAIMHSVLTEYTHWLRTKRLRWPDVDKDHLVDYLATLVDVDAAYSTIQLRRWMLMRLYRWAASEGLRPDNPAQRLAPLRRRPRNLGWVPSVAQVAQFIDAPDVGTPLGVRDRTALEMLYATGLRASELVGLCHHQFDQENRVIRLIGKGGTERLVIYGHPAAQWLEKYLMGPRQALIWQGAGHLRMTDKVFVHPTPLVEMRYFHLHRLVARYARQVGMPMMTPHVLRHAFATHMHRRGADLRILQTLLGHADLSTTTIYVSPMEAELLAVVERHHPRGVYYNMSHRPQFDMFRFMAACQTTAQRTACRPAARSEVRGPHLTRCIKSGGAAASPPETLAITRAPTLSSVTRDFVDKNAEE